MKVNKEVTKQYYVSPSEFTRQIQEYYDTDKMTDELAINILKIAENLSYNWRFINYTKGWKEEMIGDAVIKMYAALDGKKYKMGFGFSPFSYFNQIAWHAFTNRIKKENKQHEGLQEYKQMMYEQHLLESEGDIYVKQSQFDDDEDYIED